MRLIQESWLLSANTLIQSLTSLSPQAPSPPSFCPSLSFTFIFALLAAHYSSSRKRWRINHVDSCRTARTHNLPVLCSPSSELFKHRSGQLINDFMKRMPTGHGVEPVWVVTHCPGMYSWILLPVTTWFSLYLLCQLPASTAACILAEILAFTKRERFSLTSLSGQSLKHLQLAALAARGAASQRDEQLPSEGCLMHVKGRVYRFAFCPGFRPVFTCARTCKRAWWQSVARITEAEQAEVMCLSAGELRCRRFSAGVRLPSALQIQHYCRQPEHLSCG